MGFSVVDFYRDVLRIEPLPWQRWVLIHALELRPNGQFRFRTILILVARQNGKTSVVEVKNLWKMFVLRVMLVIGTAQDLDTAEESWDKAVEIVESIPELAAEVAHVDKTNGKKALKLIGGPRWKIKAASRRGARGLSGDDVNLDELREHQTWLAWGAVTKTTMARKNAQIWAFSNAGDDQSIVLNDLQAKGRAAAKHPETADPSLGLFEWSAPDDVKCTCGRPGDAHAADCRLRDRAARAQANPALGYTITEEALDSALTTDPEEIYRTECLCQRVPNLTPDWSVIGAAAWRRLATDPMPQNMLRPMAIGVDVTPERSHAAIGIAGRVDGLLYVEVAEHARGTAWVVPWVVKRLKEWPVCAVVVARNGPAGSLIPDLEAEGIEVLKPSSGDEAQACGAIVDAAIPKEGEPTLRHAGQEELDTAIRGAAKVELGDGAWRLSRRSSAVDISPVVAVTNAAWGYAMRAHEWEDDYDIADSIG